MSPNSQNSYIRNPYIVGRPVQMPDEFFGREILFTNIADSLQQNAQFILLHGQRRIGKSSVLRNIPLFVSPDEFVFVPCDLQEYGSASLNQILYAIAREIFQHLELNTNILEPLLNANLENIRRIFNRRVLAQVDEKLDNKKLVLLLDEFDVVSHNDTENTVGFLRFLETLVRQQEELFVIAVVGRYLNAMPNLMQSFRGAPFYEIGLLDNNDAQQLITQPAAQILEYQEKTIAEILKISSGHPLCTQALCYQIFQLVRNENNLSQSKIVPDYVLEAIPNAINTAEGGLDSICQGLSIPEKVVISAVAEAQENNTIENPLKLLEAYGLVLTDSLEEAIQLLINKGFLDSNPVKLKVELVRLWLLQCHPLRNEIRTLETLQENNINQLLPVARCCWMGEKQQDAALAIYEQVLQLNPNHFSTIVELAEKYLEVENFDKALKLYERVYKLDSGRYQQQFLEALNRYGHWLIIKRNYVAAKQQYEKILQIQLGNTLAQQKLAEIKAYQASTHIMSTSINYLRNLIKPNSRLVKLIFIGLISGIGSMFVGRYLLTNCTAEQQKSLDGSCINRNSITSITSNKPNPNKKISNPISNSMSRGDRTLFTSIQNSDRDRGINSFKNTKVAAQHFEEAVKKNPNDPEILIYYNNALARQKGNPLTLAVVVPAQKRTNSAQEILRGVAQAQNQFNQPNRFQDRLIEIVIADDDNNEDIAKQIAQELVQDKSILGVIGHGSSKVTNAALPIYTIANLAIVSPTSTSIDLQGSVFFRILPSDKASGEKLAKYALKNNFQKIIIFCNPLDSYSRSLKEEFRLTFFKNQREGVVPSSCINLADPNLDVEQEVQKLIDDPLVEAIALFPDTDNIEVAMKIAKTYNDNLTKSNNVKQIKVLAGDSLYKPEVANTLEGLILAVPWFRDAPKSQRFAQEAEKQWGGGVSWRTATSFDATQALIESFKLSPEVSRVTVLKNLPKINLSENTSGEQLKFDPSREINKEATLITVQDGRFVNAE
ncbi:ABC transporter substrate-binding protein [Desmonostoc muscorum LEGE 12446]|uniref:ABC transporter substrate-binding protein n=1 Tax=Desmonostoc muscorum LEGE 12446 TaxID=1828758 RepID=A0A8J7ADR9_DESMC|nr:ABC transporter substrate-binding protein [Desmonostoc muscorum]MCF2150120.1 ABC transporter substrate-binding protein [Desmonostoc muscorum LEGE 12446]